MSAKKGGRAASPKKQFMNPSGFERNALVNCKATLARNERHAYADCDLSKPGL